MTRLALLRHGHTAWNREGRLQGRTDIPLDPTAVQDLADLCLPDPWQSATLWSSPLARAAQTASLVAGRDAISEPALMEMNWGQLEGGHSATLRANPASGFRDIEEWGWNFSPRGGESPAAMRERLVPWMEGLAGDNVAVCHIGVMRVILALATGWHFDGPAPFRIKRNRLFIVENTRTSWQLDPSPVHLVERTI